MDLKLSEIIDEYWANYVELRDEDFVVKPSIPIIWFGDMEAYKKSDLKVVTVALNPSDREFCKNKGELPSFFRFPEGQNIYKENYLNDTNKNRLFKTLCGYYKNNPYDEWFNCFEKPLNHIGASYKNGNNIAVHIDIYTAVATNPTWGKLGKEQQQKISADRTRTIKLFRDFVDYLSPDVILYSANRTELNRAFGFESKDPPIKVYPTGSKGFNISIYEYNKCLIISGRNNYGKPFKLKDEFVKDTMIRIAEKDYKEIFNK